MFVLCLYSGLLLYWWSLATSEWCNKTGDERAAEVADSVCGCTGVWKRSSLVLTLLMPFASLESIFCVSGNVGFVS